MKCPNCGVENPDANMFCGTCGVQINAATGKQPSPLPPPSGAPRLPKGGPDGWYAKYGMSQLEQLNAMEKQQDVTTWTSSALYAATNGTLLVAAVASTLNSHWWLVVVLLSLLGLTISTIWFRIVVKAHSYEVAWLYRARWLQRELGMNTELSVWQDASHSPKGPRGWTSMVTLVLSFFFAWIAALLISVLLFPGNADWASTGVDAKALLSIAIGIAAFGVLYCEFWFNNEEVKNYHGHLAEELVLEKGPRKGITR